MLPTNTYALYATRNEPLMNELSNVLRIFSIDLVGIVEQYSRELRPLPQTLNAGIPSDYIDLLAMDQGTNNIFVLSRQDKHIHKFDEKENKFIPFCKADYFATTGRLIMSAIDGYLIYRTDLSIYNPKSNYCIMELATKHMTLITIANHVEQLCLAENRGRDGFLLFGSDTDYRISSIEPLSSNGSETPIYYLKKHLTIVTYTNNQMIVGMMAHSGQVFINVKDQILITDYELKALRVINNCPDLKCEFNFRFLYCMRFDPVNKILFAVDHLLRRVIAMNIENKGQIVQTWDLLNPNYSFALALIWWNSKKRQLLVYENTKYDHDQIHLLQ